MVRKGLIIFVLPFITNGCLITKTQLEIKAKLDELNAKIEILEKNKADISDINGKLDEIRKNIADMLARIDELEKKVAVLKGSSEVEKGFEILSHEIDRKLNSLKKEQLKEIEKETEKFKEDLVELRKGIQSLRQNYALFEEILVDPEGAYKRAKEMWRNGELEKAYTIFERIALIHRGHYLEDDCYYLMGKISEASGDCKKAIENYGKIIKNFNDWLTPKAYYRTAICLEKLGERKKARVFYQELIKRYPSSSETRKAKRKLKK